MGSSTTTTTNREWDIIDPFSQFNIGTDQRNAFGQDLLSTGGTGLGQLEQFAQGNFADFMKGIGGAVSSFGGLGGGGGGGGVGGVMGLGQEALALKEDPFDDKFINTMMGRGIEATRGQHDVARQNMDEYLLRSGVVGPAAAGVRARQMREQAQSVADTKKDQTLWAGQEKLNNKRMLGQMETQLRGISRQAQAQERAAQTHASGSMGAAGIAARGQLTGLLAKLGYDAANTLGTGQSMRGFGQPFNYLESSNTTTQKNNPGALGIIGTGLGFGSMFMPKGPFGGGKG